MRSFQNSLSRAVRPLPGVNHARDCAPRRLGLSAATQARALEMSGATTACHDPSRIIEQNGTYTIYSTGGTINVRTSPDLVTWSWGPGVFSTPSSGGVTVTGGAGTGGSGGSPETCNCKTASGSTSGHGAPVLLGLTLFALLGRRRQRRN
jgi:MYXO-CTERM domain-containing protein